MPAGLFRCCARPLTAALLATALVLPAFADDRARREAELEALRARIGEFKEELQRVRSRFDGLRAELGETEQRIGRLTRSISDIDSQLSQQTDRLKDLQRKQSELDGVLATQRTHFARQVRAAYAMGRQEYLKLLLNQQDPGAVGRALAYYDFLNRARSERIAALRETLAAIAELRGEIAAESTKLQQLRAQRVREVEALESTRAERRRLVQQLDAEIRDRHRELAKMQADERELESLVSALVEALADIPAEPGNREPFGKRRGQLAWPTEGPLQVAFGAPRSHGALSWQGVLIRGAEGQPVRAVSHGRVAFADWLRGYGLMLIIDHDDGYMSLYGHNQSLYKDTGDWVETGEVVATLGNSGGRDQPLLYFEIRHNGRPVDPVNWVRR